LWQRWRLRPRPRVFVIICCCNSIQVYFTITLRDLRRKKTLYKRLIGSVFIHTLYHCHERTNNQLYTFRFLLGKQNIPTPGHRVPRYAIGNMTSLNVTSFSPPSTMFFSGSATGHAPRSGPDIKNRSRPSSVKDGAPERLRCGTIQKEVSKILQLMSADGVRKIVLPFYPS